MHNPPSQTNIIAKLPLSREDMLGICNPMLREYQVSYFSFMRMYDDGGAHIFASNVEVMAYLFGHGYQIIAPIPHALLREKFNYLIPETGKYNQVLQGVRQQFNMSNVLDMVNFGIGYVDIYCYCGTPNNEQMINFYLNSTDILEKFNATFFSKISHLLSNKMKKIIVPQDMRMNFDSKFESGKQDLLLPPKQAECLFHVAKGLSAKHIAHEMRLSVRTIESYIDILKDKLNCQNKSELVKKSWSVDFIKKRIREAL